MANGDVTITHYGSKTAFSCFATGNYIGSGALIKIPIGFQPRKIILHNDTDDTTYIWFTGITAGSVFQLTSAGSKTLESGMSGPLVYAGDDDESEGFQIQADSTQMNTAADVVYFEAYR